MFKHKVPLKIGVKCYRIIGGSVAEWLKAHDSKSCGRSRVSEVRILSLPPHFYEMHKKLDVVLRIESSRFRQNG